MKVCEVVGDMMSEKSRENYPTEVYCNECFEELDRAEESPILNHYEWDPSYSDICSSCGKTSEQEKEELG